MKKYFFIISFLIGLVLVLQWKSGVPKQSLYPLDQLNAQKELLKIFVEEQQALEEEVSELRHELEGAQVNLSGLSEAVGEGVEVILADSPLVEGFVHAADLRDVINLLFVSGAEAISVNSRRIPPLNSVNVVGNTFLINDFYVFPPFTITAIGPSDVFLNRLQDESFLIDLHARSREKRLRFSYQSRNHLQIPAYRGSGRTEFLSEAL